MSSASATKAMVTRPTPGLPRPLNAWNASGPGLCLFAAWGGATLAVGLQVPLSHDRDPGASGAGVLQQLLWVAPDSQAHHQVSALSPEQSWTLRLVPHGIQGHPLGTAKCVRKDLP